MSYQNSVPVVAGADLSAAQYRAVVAAGTIAANNTDALGILQNKPENGEDATVAYNGRIKFTAGGAVTAGAAVKVTTSGYCVTLSSGDLGCGKALDAVASGAIGEGVFDFATAKTNPGA